MRSTGLEDTETNANAGGNESIPNIRFNKKDSVIHAIEQVLLSYFGEKTAAQTGNTKQNQIQRQQQEQQQQIQNDKIREHDVFLPILIQEMIFEDQLGIPVAGVMYTTDPEATGSKIGSGVTVIQAAHGPGDQVVNSLVPVDIVTPIKVVQNFEFGVMLLK